MQRRGVWHPENKPTRQQVAALMRAHVPSNDADTRIAAMLGTERARPPRPVRTGDRSNFLVGMRAERLAAAEMRRMGYHPVFSHASAGAADLVGLRTAAATEPGPPAIAVQVKSLAAFKPSGCNDGVRVFLGLAPTRRRERQHQTLELDSTPREVWLYVAGERVARVQLAPDNSCTVEGSKAQEVTKELTRMLARQPHLRTTTDSAFRQRLTAKG